MRKRYLILKHERIKITNSFMRFLTRLPTPKMEIGPQIDHVTNYNVTLNYNHRIFSRKRGYTHRIASESDLILRQPEFCRKVDQITIRRRKTYVFFLYVFLRN